MRQQQGIALITILMMVALATIVAATIAKRQSQTADNTAYLMRQDQSLLYAKVLKHFSLKSCNKTKKMLEILIIYRKFGHSLCPPFP